MTPGFVERHQDYVLGPNQDGRLATVRAGQTITGLAIVTDPEAPFLLRSRAMYVTYDAEGRQTGLNQLRLRWAGPDRDYRSEDFIRANLPGPFFGQIGNPIPVSPQVFYPRQSAITVDVQNTGTTDITNLFLYFRGVKLFAPGAVKSYPYPPRFAGLNYVYPARKNTTTGGLQGIFNFPAVGGPQRYFFQCKADADFVLRAGQSGGTFESAVPHEVFITLRDEDEKSYSNDGVQWEILFGNSNMGNIYPYGGGNYFPNYVGPVSPGILYPEIYVPANHLLSLDVVRNDLNIGQETVDLPLQFWGQKVFAK